MLLLCLFGFDPILKACFNHEIALAYSSAVAIGCGICCCHAIASRLAGLHFVSRSAGNSYLGLDYGLCLLLCSVSTTGPFRLIIAVLISLDVG